MSFQIESHTIGKNKCFIICEIGNNHQGQVDTALRMVDTAKEIGVECVKFQMRDFRSLYRPIEDSALKDDLGTEYIKDLLRKYELTPDEHYKIFEHCKDISITYMCTPWDETSVDVLSSFGVSAFKTASADLTNTPLLQKLVQKKKPIIMSTGMSTAPEIHKAANLLKASKIPFALLHCNSTYPAPPSDINLKWMESLKQIHPYCGYSGHERGINISLAAVARGAMILERHFTLDREQEGPDHAASLTSCEFTELVNGVREIELALGRNEKTVSQGEMINRENLAKSLVATRDLPIGKKITRSDITIASPGQGLSPQQIGSLLGKKTIREFRKNDFFFQSDLDERRVEPQTFRFPNKWGVPVRFHDFDYFSNIIDPDLFEFHLSYKDMQTGFDFSSKTVSDCALVVHAPELFQDSHLLDLSSVYIEYRTQSMNHMKDVISITKKLGEQFSSHVKPKIVLNAGGWSMDQNLSEWEKQERYDILKLSLAELHDPMVCFLPQTMAPFPWHFGGQRYQNLLVLPTEIQRFCEETKLKICLDISHSWLACNHFKLPFGSFLDSVLPYTSHIHMGDATGTNGEGLQIGDGEIPFHQVCKKIMETAPDATFIPEIWQGHKNNGEGFWQALKNLEKYFYLDGWNK